MLAAGKLYAAVGFAGKCLQAFSEFYPTGINRKNLLWRSVYQSAEPCCKQTASGPGQAIRKPLEP